MADSDQSISNLRYNQVTQQLEGFGGGSPMWTPLAVGGGGGGTVLPYTPTIVGAGVTPGPGDIQFFYSRTSTTVEVWGTFQVNGPTGVPLSISVPVAAHAASLPDTFAILGVYGTVDTGVSAGIVHVLYDGSDTARVYAWTLSNGDLGTSIPTKSNGDALYDDTAYVTVHFSYPIA